MRSSRLAFVGIRAIWLTPLWLALAAPGCNQVVGEGRNLEPVQTVTTGGTADTTAHSTSATEQVVAASDSADSDSANGSQSPTPSDPKPAEAVTSETATAQPAASETRTFKVEGPEAALRVSYDDFDLLKVMGLDPVPPDAPERLPKWLKDLDGKRIRVRGFMYPPFQDKDIRGFILARDNQICCFGRTPKEYDLVDVFMRPGVTTHYIQNRPFDVVGVFKIKSEIEKFTAMYELEDAVVIEK